MGQANYAQRDPESRGLYNDSLARFNDFGIVTNFFYDQYNILHPWRNPNPRRAYWNKGELIGPPFQYFKQLAYNPL